MSEPKPVTAEDLRILEDRIEARIKNLKDEYDTSIRLIKEALENLTGALEKILPQSVHNP